MSVFTEIRELLGLAQKVLILTHLSPDGDALGSLTGMGQMVARLGKEVFLAVDHGVFGRFGFLEGTERILERIPSENSADYDLLISLDCGDEERMGFSYSKLSDPKPTIINIDHHITNTQFGAINWVSPQACSTCEMLFHLNQAWELPLDEPLARSLLTGIVTDTLGFRTNSVTPQTLQIASELMRAGANLNKISELALNLTPFTTMKMWREGLNNMQLEGGVIWTTLDRYELKRANYEYAGNGGLVSLLNSVEEANIAVVLMEEKRDVIKVGFRAKQPFNVAEIARAFGGGGHSLASGCTVELPLREAEKEVIGRCKAAVRSVKITP